LQNAIAVENISFGYDEKPVLRNVSMRFEKGKKYALTGPSGCGKSTLLKLLLGWLPDYTGTIRFDGTDARAYTPEQLQQQMSYIEQNVFLFNTTIRENITLGEDFSEELLQKAIRESALAGDLANMPDGLDTIVGEEGSNLSGGQKQRVAIARALIHNRGILLVDEGTSALDQKNADIVEKSLLANSSLTLILVSHHLTDERKKQFDQVYDMTI
jgi:ATP-binding cassette subfamily B protein